jgi:hypothetical protein
VLKRALRTAFAKMAICVRKLILCWREIPNDQNKLRAIDEPIIKKFLRNRDEERTQAF